MAKKSRDDLSEIFAQDAEELNAPDQASLSKVAQLALTLKERKAAVAIAEEALTKAKKELAQIQTIELPDAMDEVGLESFKLKDGSVVSVKRGFAGTISKKNTSEAYKWLRDNGHGALIKHEFSLKFGADEDESAGAFAEFLSEEGYTFGEKETIHAQTLKAFVNEQMTKPQDPDELEDGETPFPQDLFGVFPYRIASVK